MAFKILSLGLVLLPLAACLPQAGAGATNSSGPPALVLANADSPGRINGSYITVFSKSASDADIEKCRQGMVGVMRRRSLEEGGNGTTGNHAFFDFGGFRGMTCETDPETMSAMVQEAGSNVDYVEANVAVSIPKQVQSLAATDAGPLEPLAAPAAAPAAGGAQADGKGAAIFNMDTGCNDHEVFGTRLRRAVNLVRGENALDQNGHGTHTAGSSAGQGTGTAPGADIISVKILNAAGSGDAGAILGGFKAICDYVQRNNLQGKSVVNMSLGSPRSEAINNAADEVRKCGCVLVAAAGNDGQDASTVSPASSKAAITIGALNTTSGELANFSNTGKDVDVNAAGVNVASADFQNPRGLKVLSGTSMASPQIAGKCAVILASITTSPTDDCTEICRSRLEAEAKQEKPVANVPNDTTALEIDTSNEVPIAKPKQRGGRGGGGGRLLARA